MIIFVTVKSKAFQQVQCLYEQVQTTFGLKVHYGIDNYNPEKFSVVTTGTFDGVHLGHRKLLDKLTQMARAKEGETAVISFHPHPRLVLNPDLELKLLNSLDERIERLEQAGVDHLILLPFTVEFSRQSSLHFVRDVLVNGIGVGMVVVGHDHHFGRNREGTFEDLEEYGLTYGFEVKRISAHTLDEINISSTKIRKALESGELTTAREFLGYDYELQGEVIRGRSLGSKIGFPTANIKVLDHHKLIPANGVYAVEVELGNEKLFGMMNIGVKPTVQHSGIQNIEVHLFYFHRDIYGAKVKITLKKRIRDEQRFDSLDALKARLVEDRRQSKQILGIE